MSLFRRPGVRHAAVATALRVLAGALVLTALHPSPGAAQIDVSGTWSMTGSEGAALELPASLPTGLSVYSQLVATEGDAVVACWGTAFHTPAESTPARYRAGF